MKLHIYFSCLFAPVASFSNSDTRTISAFQNILDTASHLTRQTGISCGVALPHKTISLAAGHKDRVRAINLKSDDKMGIGSATKTFTATAALKLVESGALKLDDLVLPHVHSIVQRTMAGSLEQYLGPKIKNVTVRHLLHMTSGLGDFDSRDARLALFASRQTQLDMDEIFGKHMQMASLERNRLGQHTDPTDVFSCMPGTCGEYSSTNYLLLGLMLAQASGSQHWKQYDQSSFLPAHVRRQMPSTVFPLDGKLRDFTDVHAYMPDMGGLIKSPLVKNGVMDTIDMSANIGFTVANALSSGADMASFFHALLGKDSQILTTETREEMMKLRWLETGLGNKVSVGQFYGMGIRDVSGQLVVNPQQIISNPEIFFAGLLYGHDGMSAAGFNSFNAYAPRHDFGLSFILNDGLASVLFNFLTRKLYDLASGLTQPVHDPLFAVLENKEAFMAQPFISYVKRRNAVKDFW